MSAGTRSSAISPRIPNVIALSMPIDYRDYLGWKDTLGSND